MGCWNATCHVSHMPIFGGDTVVLIPLMQAHNSLQINCCNIADCFVPIGFAITGEYNEYGGLEHICSDDLNIRHLMSKRYFVRNEDEYEEYIPKTIEDLINDVFCRDNAFVETNNTYFFPDKKAPVGHIMIHKKLYQDMIRNMGARIPYDKDKTYKQCLTAKFNASMKKHKQQLALMKDSDDVKINALNLMLRNQIYHEIAESILCTETMLHTSQWAEMAQEAVNNTTAVVKLAVEKTLFSQALNACRMGYLCASGMGSQSEETAMQVVIAKFVLQQAKKRTRNEAGTQETIFCC